MGSQQLVLASILLKLSQKQHQSFQRQQQQHAAPPVRGLSPSFPGRILGYYFRMTTENDPLRHSALQLIPVLNSLCWNLYDMVSIVLTGPISMAASSPMNLSLGSIAPQNFPRMLIYFFIPWWGHCQMDSTRRYGWVFMAYVNLRSCLPKSLDEFSTSH